MIFEICFGADLCTDFIVAPGVFLMVVVSDSKLSEKYISPRSTNSLLRILVRNFLLTTGCTEEKVPKSISLTVSGLS